ncbi:MAG: hypothetical protein QJR13_09590 [Bacillota bacterium]|nr:hypothetical protein [Bacillota bacterium]
MPLKPGRSDEVISRNIEELMHTYHETGKIGNIKPKNEKHAREIATAIAYREAGRSRKKAQALVERARILLRRWQSGGGV